MEGIQHYHNTIYKCIDYCVMRCKDLYWSTSYLCSNDQPVVYYFTLPHARLFYCLTLDYLLIRGRVLTLKYSMG
jgi:hypothetical protein